MTRTELLAIAKGELFNTEMVIAILENRKSCTRRPKKSDKPKYNPGDIMYVRETWAKSEYYFYKAGHELLVNGEPFIKRWRPSIHMPKEAARIFLRVTDIQKEYISDLTEQDAVDDGFVFGQWSALTKFAYFWYDTYGFDALECWRYGLERVYPEEGDKL